MRNRMSCRANIPYTNCTPVILVPFKLISSINHSFKPNETVTISSSLNNPKRVRVTSTSSDCRAEIDLKYRNESKLSSYLRFKKQTGIVYAIFSNHVLVQVSLEGEEFPLCY